MNIPISLKSRKDQRHTLLPLGTLAAALAVGLIEARAAGLPIQQKMASEPELSEPQQIISRSKVAKQREVSEEKEIRLAPVTVKESRQIESSGYQGEKTRLGKVPQLAKDIPQSVTIVSEQLMRDRNAYTFKEALRNVAGLTFNAGEGGRIGDNITLRGYSAVGDLFLDGMRDIAQYNRETFNLQQIDILRGSASMLFGRGSTGGVINQVSKTALSVNKNEAAVTIGSNDYKRLTIDINKVINPDLAFRLNAMTTDADTFRDGVTQKRWGVAPTLTWGAGTSDEITASYYYLNENNVPDYGVPYFQGRPLNVPIERFYGLADYDYEKNKTGITTVSYTHLFNNQTSVRTVLRKADYDRDLRAVAPRLAVSPLMITDSTPLNRQPQARGGSEHTWISQTDLMTKFETGGLKHEAITGVEYLKEEASRYTNFSPIANPATTVGNFNPNPVLPANFDSSFYRTAYNRYTAHTISAYGQDTVEFLPHWKLLLGARFDSFKADYNRPLPAEPLSRTDDVWSWRSGLMYQPDKFSTYYASYGTSFNPSAEAYQLDNRTANTPPEKSRNLELGAKWELLDGDLSVRTALFRSEKTNERNTDLSRPNIALLSGRRHTDGVELEAAGKINPRWDVFANLAVMRANVDEASADQARSKDKTPVYTPDYTYSIWTTYKLTENWKIGGGLEGVGMRYANAANTIQVPAYHRVDGLVEYEWKPWTLKLNLFNVLNEKYYEGVYTGHVLPGTSRAMQLTLSTQF